MPQNGSPAKFDKYEVKVKKLVKDAVDALDNDVNNKLTKEERKHQKEAFEKLNELGVEKRLKVLIDSQQERDELIQAIQGKNFEGFASGVKEGGITPTEETKKESTEKTLESPEKLPAKDLLGKSPAELWTLFFDEKSGKIDFHGNEDAKRHIGLGDLLESSQVWVKVDGVIGKRSFSGKKVGYLSASKNYLPIFGGEKVELLKDSDVTDAEKKAYESIAPAKDEQSLKGEFRKMVESFGAPDESIDNGENLKGKQLWQNPEFIQKTKAVADKLGIPTDFLRTIFFAESGCNPKAVNRAGGATGLIQFMPSTAAGLGTSVAELRMMSGVDQLDYVYKYFSAYKGTFQSVEHMYLYTFYPAAMSHINDPNYVFGAEKSDAYARKIAQVNHYKYGNGYATMREFKDRVQKKSVRFSNIA